MKKINYYTTTLLFILSLSYAQKSVIDDSLFKQKPQITYLDSIKKTFVVYKNAKKIDSLWMKDMASLNIYDQLVGDIKNIDVDQKVDFELPTELLKERLKKMDEKSPFNIEYNVGLENVIKSFLKYRKRSFERLMGLSQFYFPLFEEELAKNNIPLEIKYLAVVESALNTKAISRVGATGLWQFMYQTGKQYGLKINSYVDERNEPLASSAAASQYMKNMYKIFNDWDLVLAAYNSGPGNVAKAIRRSGGQQNYWNIRRNLPKETQGYLPAFLATMYIFEYHKEHGIIPSKAIAERFATDTIVIKKAMTFKQLSNLLDISAEELQFFNPSYKRNEIPYISGETNFLTLPKDKIAIFTSNEDKIYAYVEHEYNKRERPNENYTASKTIDSSKTNSIISDQKTIIRTKYYRIQKGDNLAEIARRFNVNSWNIKKWNHLKGTKLAAGKNLKIHFSERIAYQNTDDKKTRETEPVVKNEIENTTIKPLKTFINIKTLVIKEVSKTHKVKKGENLNYISQKYSVSVDQIKKWNNIKKNHLAFGQKIKIIVNEKVAISVKKEIKTPILKNEVTTSTNEVKEQIVAEKPIVKEIKNQNYYVVEKGDNLYAIAHKNKVTVAQLIEWNNLKDSNVSLGSQLIIPSELKFNDDVKNTLNRVHIVTKGDNIKTVATKYKISTAQIKEWNNLVTNNLNVNQELIVSNSKSATVESLKKNKTVNENPADYLVRKGDSLFSISKKFPGVSIADLKKWNNIKEEGLKPGMKLKING